MKKYIYAILAVAATFSSCSKGLEVNDNINNDSQSVQQSNPHVPLSAHQTIQKSIGKTETS